MFSWLTGSKPNPAAACVDSRTVRRVVIALAVVGAVAGLAGCGSQGVVKPLPVGPVSGVPKAAAEPTAPAFKLKGDASAGKPIFAKAGCKSCHTLAAAGATGTIGPNLDQAKPDYKLATTRVTFGKGQMPSFKGQLTDQQIADVAAYVVKSSGGTP
jgi:mono/diheme cytochrome c family protein